MLSAVVQNRLLAFAQKYGRRPWRNSRSLFVLQAGALSISSGPPWDKIFDCMSVLPGARLGLYEIVSWIGEGGMGEVWKARDTRLGRTVAVEISKAPFSERFEREARATAALNHPNICTLHDVGPDYLVMEMVQGAVARASLSNQIGRAHV